MAFVPFASEPYFTQFSAKSRSFLRCRLSMRRKSSSTMVRATSLSTASTNSSKIKLLQMLNTYLPVDSAIQIRLILAKQVRISVQRWSKKKCKSIYPTATIGERRSHIACKLQWILALIRTAHQLMPSQPLVPSRIEFAWAVTRPLSCQLKS